MKKDIFLYKEALQIPAGSSNYRIRSWIASLSRSILIRSVSASFAADVVSFTVTAEAGAGGSISPATPLAVNPGATAAFTITPDAGFHIDSATGCGGSLAGNIFTTGPITANCTVTAAFAVDTVTYVVSPSTGTGGSISPATLQTVNAGADVTFTVTPDSGYLIADVLVDGTSVGAVGSYTFSNVSGDHTISAVFAVYSSYPVRISGTTPRYFDTLQAAYDAAVDGETIQAKAGTFIEDHNVNRNISVTLDGGYNGDFTSNAEGTTTLSGQLRTWPDGGTLTIMNVILAE